MNDYVALTLAREIQENHLRRARIHRLQREALAAHRSAERRRASGWWSWLSRGLRPHGATSTHQPT